MLVALRASPQNSSVFADTAAIYCRAALANVGGNLASAICSGTDSSILVSSPNAIFASLGFDVPFALEIDQEAHTIRQASADFSIAVEPAVVSELSLGVDACEARGFIVSVRNNGPDTASATLNMPRPVIGVVQDWRYTCTSAAGICGAISTGTTSLSTAAWAITKRLKIFAPERDTRDQKFQPGKGEGFDWSPRSLAKKFAQMSAGLRCRKLKQNGGFCCVIAGRLCKRLL